MRIAVFDTETISIEKPFCYNIGYLIYDTDLGKILVEEDFVVEQIWHNTALFSTAYYAEKRPLYVNRMRGKSVLMAKYGHITQHMNRLFNEYGVQYAYAYNSGFDDRVFTFNSEWFKCINPFDDLKILDIRGYAHRAIAFTPQYQKWAKENGAYTETGNYSTTAEDMFRYISGQNEFDEEHTALADSEIELQILLACVKQGCLWGEEYKAYNSVPNKDRKNLTLVTMDKQEMIFPYERLTFKKEADSAKLVLKEYPKKGKEGR